MIKNLGTTFQPVADLIENDWVYRLRIFDSLTNIFEVMQRGH